MQENSPIKARILAYLEFKGVTSYAFYKASGVTRGILQQANGLSEDNLHKFLSYAQDISTKWILSGIGDMLTVKKCIPECIPECIPKPDLEKKDNCIIAYKQVENDASNRYIPLIPINAMAGVASGDVSITDLECDHYMIPAFRNKNVDFLVYISGDSMQPSYHSGDIVACSKLPLDTFFQWNRVYILDTIQGALLKRVKRCDKPDYITLYSDNKDYDPFDLHLSEVRSLSLVVGGIWVE